MKTTDDVEAATKAYQHLLRPLREDEPSIDLLVTPCFSSSLVNDENGRRAEIYVASTGTENFGYVVVTDGTEPIITRYRQPRPEGASGNHGVDTFKFLEWLNKWVQESLDSYWTREFEWHFLMGLQMDEFVMTPKGIIMEEVNDQ